MLEEREMSTSIVEIEEAEFRIGAMLGIELESSNCQSLTFHVSRLLLYIRDIQCLINYIILNRKHLCGRASRFQSVD